MHKLKIQTMKQPDPLVFEVSVHLKLFEENCKYKMQYWCIFMILEYKLKFYRAAYGPLKCSCPFSHPFSWVWPRLFVESFCWKYSKFSVKNFKNWTWEANKIRNHVKLFFSNSNISLIIFFISKIYIHHFGQIRDVTRTQKWPWLKNCCFFLVCSINWINLILEN